MYSTVLLYALGKLKNQGLKIYELYRSNIEYYYLLFVYSDEHLCGINKIIKITAEIVKKNSFENMAFIIVTKTCIFYCIFKKNLPILKFFSTFCIFDKFYFLGPLFIIRSTLR